MSRDIEAEAGMFSPKAASPVNEEDVPRRFSHSTTLLCPQVFSGPVPEATNLPTPPEPEGNFTDGSDPLFSMYNETAQQDQTMAEIWQSDINSSLVVVRYRLDHTIPV